MYQYSDPVEDFLAFDRAEQERMSRMPRCSYCGYRVTSTRLVPIGAKTVKVCPECMSNRFGHTADEAMFCDMCGGKVKQEDTHYRIAGEVWCRHCIEDLEEDE